MIQGKSYQVLLIEDDEEDALLLTEQLNHLSSLNFQIEHTVRLEAGIARAKETDPDIILLDMNLPDSSGIETVEQACSELPDVPIIVLTGLFDQSLGNDAVNLGAQDYLVKGAFSDDELLRSIQYSISRKEVEDQLRESNSLMSKIFEDVSVIIILLDENLNVLKINKSGSKLSGNKADDIIGKDMGFSLGCQFAYKGQASCGDQIDCQGCKLKDAVKIACTQKKSVLDLEVQMAVNQKTYVELRQFTAAASYISSWKKPAVLLTLNDISSLRKYQNELVRSKEKAEEANLLKTAFLANMSHEIRTPLNAIYGFAYLLNEADQTTQLQQTYLSHITQGVDQLLTIVNNVVEMSKIQAGQLTIDKTDCYPKAIVLEAYNSFIAEVENRPLELRLETNISGNFKISTDPDKLLRIMTNLLSNALKFTHHGEVLVSISQFEERIEIRVKDSGIGIPADELPNIFKGFYQVDNGLNKLYGGNGLGLTIAKHYVELLGGNINVRSELDVGTELIVNLYSH